MSVENEQATSRIAHLKKANAGVRLLSVEPLIALIGHLRLDGIDWVIVGGESGPDALPGFPQKSASRNLGFSLFRYLRGDPYFRNRYDKT